ncbi:MAG: class I SAM-dependent methyltransferase [Ruminococcaceae bacterium]|nr:class I SAM-dependent methyltransferase [Oscillospiraceae bacterium]
MNNPWKDIDLNAYESHMSLESVYQLQAMNEMMKEQFDAYDAHSVMILGIAGGNGLEHIDKDKFLSVYGVDINQDYLDECQKRYSSLGYIFKPICADLSDDRIQLPCTDLLVANLLIEYIGYDCFKNVVKKVNPKYISCIIQINTEESFVSDSPYLHVFDRLDEVHHQMEENQLINSLQKIGYTKKFTNERELPNGKKLVRIDFVR